MHFAFTFFWMRESPTIGAGPVTVAAVIAIRLSKVKLAHTPDAIAVVAKLLIVGWHGGRQKTAVVQRTQARRL